MFSRIALFFFSMVAFAQPPMDLKGIDVLVLSLDRDLLAQNQILVADDALLEIAYFAGPQGALLHEEFGERLWWIGDHPLVVLGGSGLPLPSAVLERTSAWAQVRYADALIWEGELLPRKQRLRLTQDSHQVARQIAKGGGLRYVASYLAEVANYMAGNSAAVNIDADVYKLNTEHIIDTRGINLKTLSTSGGWGTVAGNYLRFQADRSAFRVGGLDEPVRWFLTNMGAYSASFGFNNIAKGAYSVSMGLASEAYGESSVATGANTRVDGNYGFAGGESATADGEHAFSYGSSTDASGNQSVAMGTGTTASGFGSVALGSNTTASTTTSFAAGSASHASGVSSTALGFNADALGTSSIAVGNFTNANGDYSAAFGNSNNACYAATAIGRYNLDSGSAASWLSNDPLFTVGNGSTGLARHNAFEIAKNGFMQVRRDVDAAGTNPTHYVASIVNEEPTQGGDVLALSVQPINPDASSNFITFFGGGGAVGAIDGTGAGGVSYKSGSADLAEWFPNRVGESHVAAEVVTLRAGEVSKDMTAAGQAFVISTAPFLVGNDRPDAENGARSLVALMGQVPVKVVGTVQAGELLVPSGQNDGKARVLRADDGALPIVGVALTSADSGQALALVGSQPAMHPGLARLMEENQRLHAQLTRLKQDVNRVLASLHEESGSQSEITRERAQ